MRFLFTFLFTILSSSFTKATTPTFKFYRGDFTEKDKVEISNMPKVKAQGPYDICTPYASQYIIQHNICKQLNIIPCSKVSQDLEVSPIYLSAFSNPNSSDLEPGLLQNHTNLNLFDGRMNGFNILLNSSRSFAFRPESCFPSDVFNNLVGNNRDIAIDFVNTALSPFYQKNKGETECTECLKQINRLLNTSLTEAQLNRALGMRSFAEFLFAIIFPDGCGKHIRPPKKPSLGFFPKDQNPVTSDELKKKIKEILDLDLPVQIARLCTGGLIENECKNMHAVVLSGYKTICTKTEPTICRKLYKVQNTWGQEWQDQNNDGWMDAEHLLKNIEPPFNNGLLSWLK